MSGELRLIRVRPGPGEGVYTLYFEANRSIECYDPLHDDVRLRYFSNWFAGIDGNGRAAMAWTTRDEQAVIEYTLRYGG